MVSTCFLSGVVTLVGGAADFIIIPVTVVVFVVVATAVGVVVTVAFVVVVIVADVVKGT